MRSRQFEHDLKTFLEQNLDFDYLQRHWPNLDFSKLKNGLCQANSTAITANSTLFNHTSVGGFLQEIVGNPNPQQMLISEIGNNFHQNCFMEFAPQNDLQDQTISNYQSVVVTRRRSGQVYTSAIVDLDGMKVGQNNLLLTSREQLPLTPLENVWQFGHFGNAFVRNTRSDILAMNDIEFVMVILTHNLPNWMEFFARDNFLLSDAKLEILKSTAVDAVLTGMYIIFLQIFVKLHTVTQI